MKERGQQTRTEVLREVSRSIPALMRGCKLMSKAARAGVEAGDIQALAREAAAAVENCAGNADSEKALGDALLLVCALARKAKVDPEIALNEALDRFVNRFAKLEENLKNQGISMPDEAGRAGQYWDCVKLREN